MAAKSESRVTDSEGLACITCGASLPAASRFCPSCGREFSTITTGEILDGKYEILNKIGEGGMGEVFRARHLHLDEIRIIKVMKPAALGETTQQRRFAEEARLATLVRHPNVAALYDFARLPSGAYYMVWEFIDGITVLQYLRRHGRMGAEESIDISLQALAGLAEIHRAGVVHRDISPDNIMILQKDGRRVAKIIDLGIAKRLVADQMGMTGTGIFLGKLKYCSPEQAGALRPGESLDARSDLYSFGAVLYEMLSGKPLFESPTPEGYLVKHLQEQAPALDVSALPAEAGTALAAIVSRALQKDRNKRFASAAEFSAALGAIRPTTRTLPTLIAGSQTQEKTRILPAKAEAPTRISSRPRRQGVTLVIAAALAIGLGAAGYAVWRARRNAAPPISEAPAASSTPAATGTSAGPATPPASAQSVPAAAPVEPLVVERAPEVAKPASSAPAGPNESRAPEASPVLPPARPEVRAAPEIPPAPRQIDENRPSERYALLQKSAADGAPGAGQRLVEFANRYVIAHSDSPLTRQIRDELPAKVKQAGLRHEQLGHPYKAMKLFELYESLSFAPKDGDVERHLATLRSSLASFSTGAGQPEAPAGSLEPALRLEHEPIRRAFPRRDLVLTARWPGGGAEASGTIFYRADSTSPWRETPLRPAGGGGALIGRIPASDLVPPVIEYYLVATTPSGSAARKGSPQRPFLVMVGRR